MAIDKLIIENFKGLADRQDFEIRPLTLFCGPNSSGKSSCIHAMAAMAQTVKLSASKVPVVLDDEYAQVHLGRFLDVVHSSSLSDSFTLGIGFDKSKKIDSSKENSLLRVQQISLLKNSPLRAEFEFKARGAAQELFIQSAKVLFGNNNYLFSKKTNSTIEFNIVQNDKEIPQIATSVGRLSFQSEISFADGKGPNDTEFNVFMMCNTVSQKLNSELGKTFYLGPFRQGPLRKYPTRGSQPTEVGAAGEAAVAMLANEFSKSKTKHPNLKKISDWLGLMKLGRKLEVVPVGKTDLFDVAVTLDDGAKLLIPDLGYGVSQVLPVLVQCSFAPNGATLLFEQPELHLHEGAAGALAHVFVETIKEKDVHILAETHSPHLFLEVIRLVKAGLLSPEQVVLYDVKRVNGKSEFRKVLIEEVEPGLFEADHPWVNSLK